MLKGYTIGLAEEFIQRYYDLIEVVDSYAVDDIHVFHKEKWKPILVYKSKFNESPFRFEKAGANFGEQDGTSNYYQNAIFQSFSIKLLRKVCRLIFNDFASKNIMFYRLTDEHMTNGF